MPTLLTKRLGKKNDWIFARKGDGYLALRSQNPYFWNEEDSPRRRGEREEKIKKNFVPFATWRLNREDMGREVIAPGKQNIWLCQMGRKADEGTFAEFVGKISAAEVAFSGMNVQYRSPGNGVVRFGWETELSVDGVDIQLHDYPRYENPYVNAEFDPTEIHVAADGHELHLNWKTEERKTE